MSWSQKRFIVEPDFTEGSRRRASIGGASVAKVNAAWYAWFGVAGDWREPAYSVRMYLPDVQAFPQLEGFRSGFWDSLDDPENNPMWGIDHQSGSGTRFDKHYAAGGSLDIDHGSNVGDQVVSLDVDGARALCIDPTHPEPSWQNWGAKNPSVLKVSGGLMNGEDPLADVDQGFSVAIEYFAGRSAKDRATLVCFGDRWDLRASAGFLEFRVLTDERKYVVRRARMGFANDAYYIHAWVNQLTSKVGLTIANQGANIDAVGGSVSSDADNDTAISGFGLPFYRNEPLKFLNSWCGRHPWLDVAGGSPGILGSVGITTGPLDHRNTGRTLAVSFKFDEGTGAIVTRDDSPQGSRREGRLTNGVGWEQYANRGRYFLAADFNNGSQGFHLLTGAFGTSEVAWVNYLAGTTGVIKNIRAANPWNVRLVDSDGLSDDLAVISVTDAGTVTDIYGQSWRKLTCVTTTGATRNYSGDYLTTGSGDYALDLGLAGGGAPPRTKWGLKITSPEDGSGVDVDPIVPGYSYLMAYEGIVNWAEVDDAGVAHTVTGKSICLAVSADPARGWDTFPRLMPVVASVGIDGEAHKDIHSPCLASFGSDRYLFWSEEDAPGSGQYHIRGLHLGRPDDVFTRHHLISSNFVTDSSTVSIATVLRMGLQVTNWDGQSLGSLELTESGAAWMAWYSARDSTGAWELARRSTDLENPDGSIGIRRAVSEIYTSEYLTAYPGGVTNPSEMMMEPDAHYLLAQIVNQVAESGQVGRLALLENPDRDDTVDDQDRAGDREDYWDPTLAGDHGSANAITGGIRWPDPDGTMHTFISSGAHIYAPEDLDTDPEEWLVGWASQNLVTGDTGATPTPLYLSPVRTIPHFEPTDTDVYVCGGVRGPFRLNKDETAYKPGVLTPAAPTSWGEDLTGSLTAGDYKVKLAWKRGTVIGSMGDESSEVAIASNKGITITLPDWGDDSEALEHYQVDGVVVYADRNTGDGYSGTWTQIHTQAILPATILVKIPAWPTTTTYGSTDRAIPPAKSEWCRLFKGCMFWQDPANLGQIVWSTQEDPGIVPAANAEKFDVPGGGLTGAIVVGDQMLIFAARGIWVCYGTPDATGAGFYFSELTRAHGTPWFRSMEAVGASCFFWFNGQLWRTSGQSKPVAIGDPLDPLWNTVSAAREGRVELKWWAQRDLLSIAIPSSCNIPNRRVRLFDPSNARGALLSGVGYYPTSNEWVGCQFLSEHGELIGGDSRLGRLLQLEQGDDDDREGIRSRLLTSSSKGRGFSVVDCWRWLVASVSGMAGSAAISVIVDSGAFSWLRDVRVSPEPNRFIGAQGFGLGGLQTVALVLRDVATRLTLPIMKGRQAAILVEVESKGQRAVVRELGIDINNAMGRDGPERGTGRTQRGLTRVRWPAFVGTNMKADPAELPSNIMASSDNMDPEISGSARCRPGRRNLSPGVDLNTLNDGVPK